MKQCDSIADYQRFQRELCQPPSWFRNPSRYDAAPRSAWFSQTPPSAGQILPSFPYNLNGEFADVVALTESSRRPTSTTSEVPTVLPDDAKSAYRMHAERTPGDPTVDCNRTQADLFVATTVSTATVTTAAFDPKLTPSCTNTMNPYEFCCSQTYGGGDQFNLVEKGGDEYSIHGV
ncbi:unnamed protein product [Schistocephalus solidus]|uniref:Uncharacterized protein n=1 Tax=Schistocephalus solidus TaxID=70667 RepID=A0A183TK94_SCHSO|nr:unnamed protein product [Schistocephalus solidus]